MSTINKAPSDLVKQNPDVYGFVVKKEKEETVTIKGIEMKIKKYSTTMKTNGIRISLADNSGEFFVKFNEFLIEAENQRPAEEKVVGLWGFTTLSNVEEGLKQIEGAGFYVYQNHIIFNEEEKSLAPMDRLVEFVEYFKKKFDIRTIIKEDEFSDLDKLELG
jgi:hypothetical protein